MQRVHCSLPSIFYQKEISLPRCLFCFTWYSGFPYYCILVSWTKWQGHNAIRTETITTGDNNSNKSNNNSRSSGFSNPMPLQRPALWQRTQVFQSRHFQICSKGFKTAQNCNNNIKILKLVQRVEKLCKCVQNVSQGGAGSQGSAVATGSAASRLAFARPAVDKM